MPKGKGSQLVVVANRLPVNRVGRGKSLSWEQSPGGLVTALTPVLKAQRGSWIGWSGAPGRAPHAFSHDGVHIRPVSLSRGEMDTFYNGLCNRTLWPLFHDAIRAPEFHHRWWIPYIEVNKRFARAAASVVKTGDVVWMHDYHLMLAPAMLRSLKPGVRIGFFLHIPFPPQELFEWLPWRTRILEGLLGADVLGFQTLANARNFSRAARSLTGATGSESRLEYGGRQIKVGAFPISVDFDAYEGESKRADVVRASGSLRQRLGPERKVILCVDRLDYTKGIDWRLRTFEMLLRRGRYTADDCVMLQIAVPSREPVREYAEIRTEIEMLVGRINGQFGSAGRVAVHYLRRGFSRRDLVAYYRAADVMAVTPLRDGMNLVAKEYVAARTDGTGVLILSEFAGAASELRRAMLVNPRDIEGTAEAMEAALSMPTAPMRQRMAAMRLNVRRNNVYAWAESFLGALAG